MDNFTNLESVAKALCDLRDFLEYNDICKKQADWAKLIGKTPQILSRNFRNPQSLGEANGIFKNTLKAYGLGCEKDKDGNLTFTKVDKRQNAGEEKLTRTLAAPSKQLLAPFIGVYIGQFLRFNTKEFSDIILAIHPDGSVNIKTDRFLEVYEGRLEYARISKSFIITCDVGDGRYYAQFVLKSDFKQPTDGRKPFLTGVYSAFSVATLYTPVGGVIKFDFTYPLPNKSRMDISRQFDALTPLSINMANDDLLDKLMHNRPDDLMYFLGQERQNENNAWEDIKDVLFSSVTFFKTLKLIPSFDFHARQLSGTYLIFRLSTNRQILFARPLSIQNDGRIKLRMTRDGRGVQTYHGRAHVLRTGNGCMAISIDRVTVPKVESDKHRTHYLFKINAYDNREDIQYLFGKSLIINLNGEIRTGDEILVRVENDFEDLEQINLSVRDTQAISQLPKMYKDILAFLQKGVISTVKKDPNDRNFESFEDDFGFIYFSAACMAADIDVADEASVLDYLEKSFSHGFDDRDLLQSELEEDGTLFDYADLIDVENMCLK
jgi:hypothetical protein